MYCPPSTRVLLTFVIRFHLPYRIHPLLVFIEMTEVVETIHRGLHHTQIVLLTLINTLTHHVLFVVRSKMKIKVVDIYIHASCWPPRTALAASNCAGRLELRWPPRTALAASNCAGRLELRWPPRTALATSNCRPPLIIDPHPASNYRSTPPPPPPTNSILWNLKL